MSALPRLPQSAQIVNSDGTPSQQNQIWWDQVAAQLEQSIGDLQATTAALAAAQADILTVQADIVAAQADILEALATMPPVPDVHIPADYTGTVDSALFPVTVSTYRLTGSTDNTLSATWSFTLDSGDLTATISNGVLSITTITTTSMITVTSIYDGITRSVSFNVYLDIAAPPTPPPAAGTSASDTSFATINSTTHAAISDELTVTVGSTGTVTLTAPALQVSTTAASPTGTFKVWGKWQWWNGAAWADVGSEVASSPSCKVNHSSDGSGGDTGSYTVAKGSLSVPQSKTGLTVGGSEKFRFEARNDSGTRVMTFSGTVTAAG